MPGSGKSTLASRVAEIIEGKGIGVRKEAYVLAHCVSRRRRVTTKLLYVLSELFLEPRYALRSARAIAATSQNSTMEFIKGLFNWLFVTSLARPIMRFNGVHMLDQGVFQALWSIAFSGGPNSLTLMVAKLLDHMPVPNVIVIMHVEAPTVARRLAARQSQDSRLERLLEKDPGIMARSTLLFRETVETVELIKGRYTTLEVVSIDNNENEELETNAQAVAEMIYHKLEAGPAPKKAIQ
ncbi:hypothetical protein Nwat_2841 [Nitrosococcus watsonii C-113]|uniref:Thymidylate kinase-like protein n=2 Tax=Nitrosococcus TaxID=1227 RepID=D8KBE6_NITWC|nr:hypothetical protein Nwat_2841 [Nitrosococcus watsonii C-113]